MPNFRRASLQQDKLVLDKNKLTPTHNLSKSFLHIPSSQETTVDRLNAQLEESRKRLPVQQPVIRGSFEKLKQLIDAKKEKNPIFMANKAPLKPAASKILAKGKKF